MAFTAGLCLEVRNGGTDGNSGNGGGFDTGATFATNGSISSANTSSPVLSSATYNFVAGDVGAWVFLSAGTNVIPGFYKIASVASNQAALDAAVGHAWLWPAVMLNTVAGCGTAGSLTSITWGVDYSQQDGAQITYTDLSAAGAGSTFTSAGNPFGQNHIGNIIAVSSGTNCTVQRVAITSVSGTTATFDKAVTTGATSNGAGKLGGALKTPGQAGALQVASALTKWQYNATPFTATATTNNAASGRITITAGSATGLPSRVIGYDQVPGDETSNIPTFRWGVNAASNGLITVSTSTFVSNIILSGNKAGGWTATRCLIVPASANYITVRRCKMTSCKERLLGISGDSKALLFEGCEFTDCDLNAIENTSSLAMSFAWCDIHDNVGHGMSLNTGCVVDFIYCIFDTNNNGASGSSHIYTASSAASIHAYGCVFYNAGSDGISFPVAQNRVDLYDCVFESNGAYGLNQSGNASTDRLRNCAFYNNTSGKYAPAGLCSVGEISQSAGSFFVDAANRDFTPNATGGQGALLRSAAYPSAVGLSNTYQAYQDVGAVRHQDPAGGGAGYSRSRRGVLLGM